MGYSTNKYYHNYKPGSRVYCGKKFGIGTVILTKNNHFFIKLDTPHELCYYDEKAQKVIFNFNSYKGSNLSHRFFQLGEITSITKKRLLEKISNIYVEDKKTKLSKVEFEQIIQQMRTSR